MPTPHPLRRSALPALVAAAIVVPLVAGLAGGPVPDSALARAAHEVPLVVAGTSAPVETELAAPVLEASTPTTIAPAPPTTAPPTTAPPTTAPPTTAPPATTPPTTPPPTTAPSTPEPQPQPGTAAADERDVACEADLIRWTNETRAEHGLGALATDEAIRAVAVDWSTSMAARSTLEHNPNFSDQVFAKRPEARIAGENVGRSGRTARAVYDEFVRSDGHRAKILSTNYGSVTTGCVRSAEGLWVTMNFWG